MTDKTKLYESLEKFVDAVASGDDEAQRDQIKEYITSKSKTILELTGDSAIKLDGDDVLVNGKKVGQVKTNADDMESGIDFVSDDGSFSKEFDDIPSLYSFIADRYNVKEGVFELVEGDVKTRVKDAVGKQDTAKTPRLARLAASQKAGQQADGTPGDYEKGDLDDYHDPEKGKSGEAAHSGHEPDARHKKGYHDAHDVRKQHKDPVRGGSDAANAGGASDLDTDGGYDSHDVRKKHNS